jgi:hypothetical protein
LKIWIHHFFINKTGIHCFSAKHASLRSKSKEWLALNQDNVSVWGEMSIHGLLCQWASTMKIHRFFVMFPLVPFIYWFALHHQCGCTDWKYIYYSINGERETAIYRHAFAIYRCPTGYIDMTVHDCVVLTVLWGSVYKRKTKWI